MGFNSLNLEKEIYILWSDEKVDKLLKGWAVNLSGFKSNFDGFFFFNASNGANFFSTFKNWEKLRKFADMYNLIFVPTVSPGFHDSKAKYNPMRRFRSNGMYFECKFYLF